MIIVQLTPEQLQEQIQKAVDTGLAKMQPHQPDKLLTRREAAKLLDISLPTLTSWEKSKQIAATRIGSRVYFKQSGLIK
ncbi:MAG: helix-turn-helix domain-containing protein [Cytophagales bacterium]|nr:helix-turn-helix domain-containing protein [Cytophagales bacterium]